VNNALSDTFVSCLGVRQEENVSQILFSIFLNELVFYMSTHCEGLQILSDQVNEQLNNDEMDVFLKLYLFLYADDTVVCLLFFFAEIQTGLQQHYTASLSIVNYGI
jgi:hypothetical protein